MSRQSLFTTIPLVLFFLLLYLLTTNQIFSFDAITNAIACESHEPIRWFHPNHVLYPFMPVLYYRLEMLMGYQGLSIYSLARFNSLMTAIGLSLLSLTFSKFMNKTKAIFSAILCGVCYSIWAYAVDGRAVGTALFFIACLILFLTSVLTGKKMSMLQIVFLSILSSLYIFSHSIGIFHVGPIFVWLWKRNPEQKNLSLGYMGILFGILIAVYGAVYSLVTWPLTHSSFPQWIIGYAGFGGVQSTLKSQFWAQNIWEGLQGLWIGWKNFFYPNFYSRGISHMLGSEGVGLIMLSIFGLAIWQRFKPNQNSNSLVPILFYWGLISQVFLIFWSPGQEGFRIHVCVPWMVAAILLLKDHKHFLLSTLCLATIILVLNLVGPLGYAASIQNNTGFQLLNELNKNINAGDVFLSAEDSFIPNVEVYRPYFFPQIRGGTLAGRLFAFHENSFDNLAKRLMQQEREGSHIYWGGDVLDRSRQEKIERQFNLPPKSVENLLQKFNLNKSFVLSNGSAVYVSRTN